MYHTNNPAPRVPADHVCACDGFGGFFVIFHSKLKSKHSSLVLCQAGVFFSLEDVSAVIEFKNILQVS